MNDKDMGNWISGLKGSRNGTGNSNRPQTISLHCIAGECTEDERRDYSHGSRCPEGRINARSGVTKELSAPPGNLDGQESMGHGDLGSSPGISRVGWRSDL